MFEHIYHSLFIFEFRETESADEIFFLYFILYEQFVNELLILCIKTYENVASRLSPTEVKTGQTVAQELIKLLFCMSKRYLLCSRKNRATSHNFSAAIY